MNRSDFLKTLGLAAVGVFAPVSKSAALVLKGQLIKPAAPGLPEALSGDVLRRILDDRATLQFVRDAFVPWSEDIHYSKPYLCALESDIYAGHMAEGGDRMFLENIEYILADFIRERHSQHIGEVDLETYLSRCIWDPFPVKRLASGVRIAPFLTVATTLGTRLELNPAWAEAPLTEGIVGPILARYACRIDVRAVTREPEAGSPLQLPLCFLRATIMVQPL